MFIRIDVSFLVEDVHVVEEDFQEGAYAADAAAVQDVVDVEETNKTMIMINYAYSIRVAVKLPLYIFTLTSYLPSNHSTTFLYVSLKSFPTNLVNVKPSIVF
ncbi:hypothetical protein [Metaclostridioides mangenotii]|uniref:Uncharacterized protein n=1 Tax=Metaclostridioides mangenotii TaxID=1540 RepID=A0ABS4E6Q1_9FIRM|nr:hypothetical protein [Clostridioides mangenotii]MBP1853619.1 hypothetical protein [Clostridioides mangenotii]